MVVAEDWPGEQHSPFEERGSAVAPPEEPTALPPVEAGLRSKEAEH